MGDHIIISEGSIINTQSIGSYVHIGKNCIIVSHAHVYVGGAAFTFVLSQSCSCILKDAVEWRIIRYWLQIQLFHLLYSLDPQVQ